MDEDLHVIRAAIRTVEFREDFDAAIKAIDRVEVRLRNNHVELLRLREVHRTVSEFRRLMQEGIK
jgi:hypothetical protein